MKRWLHTIAIVVVYLLTFSNLALANFITEIRIDDAPAGTTPRIGSSSQQSLAIYGNNIYIAWYADQSGVHLSKSDIDQLNFQQSVTITTSTSTGAPSITIDKNGVIYVAWTDFSNGETPGIYLAKSTDGGATFSANVKVDDAATGYRGSPVVRVDNLGNVFVAWYDDRNYVPNYYAHDVFIAKSIDGGLTFSPNTKVNDFTSNEFTWPSLEIDNNNIIYISWYDSSRPGSGIRMYMTKSIDGGQTFSPSQEIASMGNAYQISADWPAVLKSDSNANLYLIFFFSNYGTGIYDVKIIKSSDGGATFTTPIQINTIEHEAFPSIDIDSTGNIYSAWSSYSYPSNIMFSKGSVRLNFSKEIQTNSFTFNSSRGPHIVVDQKGTSYLLWQSDNGLFLTKD